MLGSVRTRYISFHSEVCYCPFEQRQLIDLIVRTRIHIEEREPQVLRPKKSCFVNAVTWTFLRSCPALSGDFSPNFMAFLLCTCSDLELIVSLCLTRACTIRSIRNKTKENDGLDEKGHVKNSSEEQWARTADYSRPGCLGGTPLYKPYKYVPPPWIGFGGRFGLDFAHFGLESGMGFEGTTGVYECIYRCSSKWVSHKEKYANSKCIFRNLFFLLF